MHTFEPIEDSSVLLLKNGTYIESKLFTRGSRVYVKHGSGFAKVNPNNTTSINKLFVKEIEAPPIVLFQDGCELGWRYPDVLQTIRPKAKAAAK